MNSATPVATGGVLFTFPRRHCRHRCCAEFGDRSHACWPGKEEEKVASLFDFTALPPSLDVIQRCRDFRRRQPHIHC